MSSRSSARWTRRSPERRSRLPAEHRRRRRAVRLGAAARRQDARRRPAGRLRLRALRLQGTRYRSHRSGGMMRVCLMVEGQEDVTWEQWLALARAAEDAGLDGLFRSDHYSAIIKPLAGALDAWATLSALAAVTSRIRLGTLVSPATFRHPSVLARMATTVDHISGGRVELGMGAGWYERDHTGERLPVPRHQGAVRALRRAGRDRRPHVDRRGLRSPRRALHAARADGAAEAPAAAASASRPRRQGGAARRRARRALRDGVQHARRVARRGARAAAAPGRRVRGDRT